MFSFMVPAHALRRPALDWELAAFRDCRSGVTAIEFAVAGPVLFIAMLEILQGGMFLYSSAALERATVAAARASQVGNLPPQKAGDAVNFRTQVLCPALMPDTVGYENVRVNSLIPKVPGALQSCASSNWFYTASSADEITRMLNPMFTEAVAVPRLTQ